jgi:hypothetical protein
MYKQVTERLDLEELRRAGHGQGLIDLLGHMLAKDRAQRSPTWEAALAEAHALLARRAAGQPPTQCRVPAPAPARRWTWPLAAAGLLAVLAATGWWMLGGDGRVRQARPATLALLAADAGLDQGRTRELVLAPGSYPDGLRLGAGHRGLLLRAGGPGVVLGGAPGTPALRCEPGCDDVRLEGIELAADDAPAVEVLPGARVRLDACTVRGRPALRVAGRLEAGGCRLLGGCEAGPQGTLLLHDGQTGADRAPALSADQAEVVLRRMRLRGAAQIRGGSLRLDGVAVDGLGAAFALDLERVSPAELTDVELGGAAVALRGHGTTLTRLERITLVGAEAGATWVGPVDPAWTWRGVRCRAPTVGLPGQAGDGAGADPAGIPPP